MLIAAHRAITVSQACVWARTSSIALEGGTTGVASAIMAKRSVNSWFGQVRPICAAVLRCAAVLDPHLPINHPSQKRLPMVAKRLPHINLYGKRENENEKKQDDDENDENINNNHKTLITNRKDNNKDQKH